MDYKAKNILVNAKYQDGDITGDIIVRSDIANLDLQLQIKELLTEPDYDGILSIEQLDLGQIFLPDSIKQLIWLETKYG